MNATLINTKFNDAQLLHSAAGAGFGFQVGERTDTLSLNFASGMASTGNGGYATGISVTLGSFANLSATTLASTQNANSLAGLQTALSSLKQATLDSLGKIGNFSQRLDIKEETLNVSIANAESSISRLFDSDIALEQLNATKGTILSQAASAMFAQLNMSPQQVLQLFG